MSNRSIQLGALNAFMAICLGAFAAHALHDVMSAYSREIFHTAFLYHMFHALGLILIGLLQRQGLDLTRAALIMQLGIVLFSGSLYVLALSGIKQIGMITPLGGILLLAAWLLLFLKARKS